MRPGTSKQLLGKAKKLEKAYFKDYGLNEGLRHLFSSIGNCKVIIARPEDLKKDANGMYKEAVVYLSSNLIGTSVDLVLLHEMIHFYESWANDNRSGTRYLIEYLSFYLLDQLKAMLPLKKIIEYEIYSMVPAHTYFFLFMSIALDFKLKKPPGTVFGYGKTEAWRHYCGL